jgi:hypothetical protein
MAVGDGSPPVASVTAHGGRTRAAGETAADATDVRVPTTQTTLMAWAEIWISMCGDDKLWSRPLTDDDHARARYGRSARQLRRLRQAVLSGALRRQAEQLGVKLPDGFVDNPVPPGAGGAAGSPSVPAQPASTG